MINSQEEKISQILVNTAEIRKRQAKQLTKNDVDLAVQTGLRQHEHECNVAKAMPEIENRIGVLEGKNISGVLKDEKMRGWVKIVLYVIGMIGAALLGGSVPLP